jgi:hypothetical protein
VIVVIKVVGRRTSRREAFQCGAIDEEDVGPAVVVVIEDGHACTGALQDVGATVFAAKNVGGGKPGLLGDICEIGDWCRLAGGGRRLLSEHLCQDKRQENEKDPTRPDAPGWYRSPSSPGSVMTWHGAEVLISRTAEEREHDFTPLCKEEGKSIPDNVFSRIALS